MRAAIYRHNYCYFQTHSNLAPKGQSFGPAGCHGEVFYSALIEYINVDLMVIHTGLGVRWHKRAKNSHDYGSLAREKGYGQILVLKCVKLFSHIYNWPPRRFERNKQPFAVQNFLFGNKRSIYHRQSPCL